MMGNGREIVADTFSQESFDDYWFLGSTKNEKKRGLAYEDKETDPLRWHDGITARCVCRGALWMFFDPNPYAKFGKSKEEIATIRLCIGPDLMKEKGYKFKPPKK